MPFNDFISRRPRVSFITIGAACLGIGLVVTQVEATISDSAVMAVNNPHNIPDQLNPRFKRAEEKLQAIKFEAKEAFGDVKEEIVQEAETIHSIAFKGKTANSKPVYDYTTGTSN